MQISCIFRQFSCIFLHIMAYLPLCIFKLISAYLHLICLPRPISFMNIQTAAGAKREPCCFRQLILPIKVVDSMLDNGKCRCRRHAIPVSSCLLYFMYFTESLFRLWKFGAVAVCSLYRLYYIAFICTSHFPDVWHLSVHIRMQIYWLSSLLDFSLVCTGTTLPFVACQWLTPSDSAGESTFTSMACHGERVPGHGCICCPSFNLTLSSTITPEEHLGWAGVWWLSQVSGSRQSWC